jgi:hypothetical protein
VKWNARWRQSTVERRYSLERLTVGDGTARRVTQFLERGGFRPRRTLVKQFRGRAAMVASVIKDYLFKKQFVRIWIKDRPKKGIKKFFTARKN